MRVCNVPGCPNTYPRREGSRCRDCRRKAERRRGTSAQRGYAGARHAEFRDAVLVRDPVCRIDGCTRPSTVADHWPLSRRELVARCLNANDPKHGRGLCGPHHSRETTRNQPGGWNRR